MKSHLDGVSLRDESQSRAAEADAAWTSERLEVRLLWKRFDMKRDKGLDVKNGNRLPGYARTVLFLAAGLRPHKAGVAAGELVVELTAHLSSWFPPAAAQRARRRTMSGFVH
ncbi:hypothetical protein MGYG_05654 [Nannizzia gypsea CBS 118893]|uniref:Uncharacterized protein n=1 Tax=Arthroderma gypseum (strain ATCC MYA-4604 / CBS 118893) TaxID=535722 RepID=E4UX18_ARTGP|nr:hypothetical protein MGYG_05654 [Nannizzia gypsea CBS 118893]EFR02657.1 hypothetical protein MGYG_05654 [Nannizzia gypsea CBS 118893]